VVCDLVFAALVRQIEAKDPGIAIQAIVDA
jgi:hypothetical protein